MMRHRFIKLQSLTQTIIHKQKKMQAINNLLNNNTTIWTSKMHFQLHWTSFLKDNVVQMCLSVKLDLQSPPRECILYVYIIVGPGRPQITPE